MEKRNLAIRLYVAVAVVGIFQAVASGFGVGYIWYMDLCPGETGIWTLSVQNGSGPTMNVTMTVRINDANVASFPPEYLEFTIDPGVEILVPVTVTVPFDAEIGFVYRLDVLCIGCPGGGGICVGGNATCNVSVRPPKITIDDVWLPEGDGGETSFDFRIRLSPPIGHAVTVDYTTEDGSATLADDDYQFSSGTVTFDPCETIKTITVLVNGDSNVETDETFFVNLSNPTNAAITDAQGIGTIEDDDPPCYRIQHAIDLALDGDTVIVPPGIYTGRGNRDIDFRGKAITVRSINPTDPNVVAATVIDCQGTVLEPHRGFYFHSGEDTNSIVEGLTITNGCAPDGGGIYCSGSSPRIVNCIISNNSAIPTPWMSDGGGIRCDGGSPMLVNCTIKGNSASWGGGISLHGASPMINGCIISDNSAVGCGGGGIYCSGSSPKISNCVISGNNCGGNRGGGICSQYGSTPILNKCTISGNLSWRGGAIHCLYDWSSTSGPIVSNCILWGNAAARGREIYLELYSSHPDTGTKINVCYSDVQGGEAEVVVETGCTLNWGEGNIDVDPCFADPENTDYHLKSQAGRWDPNRQRWVRDSITSPCIDAGDPNSDWTGELWPHGKRINMGFHGGTPEASMSLSGPGNIADLNNDGVVDFLDFAYFADAWETDKVLLSEDFDRNGTVDVNDLAAFAEHWLEPLLPGMATNPNPFDGWTGVPLLCTLSWSAGTHANQHAVYIGTSYPLIFHGNQTATTFDLGLLEPNTTYFWRIDELNEGCRSMGEVWRFTTTASQLPLSASNPSPHDGATNVALMTALAWSPGLFSNSHDVYFANTNPPLLQGNQMGTAFSPGVLEPNTTYFWRIDEINAHGETTGEVWSFTTGQFYTLPNVFVPGGEFEMGDNLGDGLSNELPVHTVTLDSFCMGMYEITNEQYCQYLNSALVSNSVYVSGGMVNGSGNNQPYCDTSTSSSYSQISYSGGVFSVRTKDGRSMSNDPMVMVSWYGSAAYCNWLSQKEGKEPCYDLSTWECDFSKRGYRLPTEAEWEYAARGGLVGNRFPWGDTISHSQANYYSDAQYAYDVSPTRGSHPLYATGDIPYTSPVGSFAPNNYGLYDMAGNVNECCNDWYSDTYYGSSPYWNPTGPASGSYRVIRGGSWNDSAFYCRVATRNWFIPYNWHRSFGFRVVLDLQ